jgi:SAM-dependent methyltransferase
MCSGPCIQFAKEHLLPKEIANKKVIEVGAFNVNGSLRDIVEEFRPSHYLGVDIEKGPGVDEICSIHDLAARYGYEAFDLVIATEILEHICDWRSAISNLKNITKPEGTLIVTTRSINFPYHGYPYDFWRYELEDMKNIFSDFSIDVIEKDPLDPGVFVKLHKPEDFRENDLGAYKLYSVVKYRRCKNVSEMESYLFKCLFKASMPARRFLSRVLPFPAVKAIKSFLREEIQMPPAKPQACNNTDGSKRL